MMLSLHGELSARAAPPRLCLAGGAFGCLGPRLRWLALDLLHKQTTSHLRSLSLVA